MSSDDDQKRLWQEEAEQLKEDLANRPKEVQYREKEIKFGGVAKKSVQSSSFRGSSGGLPSNYTNLGDLHIRSQLGIDQKIELEEEEE